MAETPTEWQQRIRSVGYLGQGRTRTRVLEEGRQHPESGEPYVTRRDECGNDVTEHGALGSGCSDRQDVNINAKPIKWDMREHS